MTKAEYIDFIRNSLQAVDKTAKYHPEQVAAAINVAVNTVFYEVYKDQPRIFAKSMERYTTQTQLIPVNTSAVAPRYTAPVTVDIVDLPRKTGGILEILQKTLIPTGLSSVTTYIPVTTMEGEQFYGSEASLPDNVVGFSWSGARVVEFWGMSVTQASNTVLARYIKQFKSYSSTDNVVLPYGQDQRIIELVREYLGAIPPKDLVNNNADPQRNG